MKFILIPLFLFLTSSIAPGQEGFIPTSTPDPATVQMLELAYRLGYMQGNNEAINGYSSLEDFDYKFEKNKSEFRKHISTLK